jgi:hypothetical protein
MLRSAFDRFRHFADQRGDGLPTSRRELDQQSKVPDKGIAAIFQVEFESFLWKYSGASRRLAVSSGKRQRRILKQKNPADLAFGITGNPKAFPVAADEKCRDGLVDDTGIERRKWRPDHGGLAAGRHAAALALMLDRGGGPWGTPKQVWAG